MSTIGQTNIKFSDLRNFLGQTEGTINISLSEFRGVSFTDGSSVPTGNSEISIGTHFKGKTFEGSNNSFTTDDFNFNLNFSGEGGGTDRLYPVLTSNETTKVTSSKMAKLTHSSVNYWYPSILLCPQAGDPTIGTEDDATVWIKMKLNSPFHFMFGIIHKQGQSSWENVASAALRYRHGAYNDRINIHTYGYVTHAGHDIESSTKTDELMNTTITNETTTSNYHNRIGETAGSGNGFAVVPTNKYYLTTDFTFFQSKLTTSSEYYIGMILNYYEITLTGTVSYNSSTISNIQLNGSQLTSSDNVYTGMYLSSTESGFPSGSNPTPNPAMIQSITYSSSTSLVMGDEITGTAQQYYTGSSGTITFKALGQRLEFQYAGDCGYSSPKNIGPNHIILPRKYRTSSNGSNIDIDSWAFFVGDSTSGSNTGTFTIQDSNPPNLYEVTYNFSGQTAQETTGDWSPKSGTEMEDWVNGSSVVNGIYWIGSKIVKGWNLSNQTDGNATRSSYTGPDKGHNNSSGFMYTEVTSGRHAYVFLCRTPAFNFSTLMEDTSNDLKLKFKVHGYGAHMGGLFIHISTSSTTTHSSSTQLGSYTSFIHTGHTSAWTSAEISLNSYRTVNSNHYIYFASYNATSWQGDLSVDYVQICETPS